VNQWRFKLLYDGQCPMCRREANWLMRRNRNGHLAFEDISARDFDASRFGLTQDQVMGVMHGVFPDGRIVTKVEAFRQAYHQVSLGWLLAPTDWPILRGLSNWGYEWFARNRVTIGRWFGGESCETGHCAVPATRKIPPVDSARR
jgi:predicted DCC family thiol-disulfide oxidoreductase YuxK